jgi:TPR repeat protein
MLGRVNLAGLTIVLALCVRANATPLEDAEAAYTKADYPTAVALFRPLAEKGDAAAQNRMGQLYQYGQGLPRDFMEALKWFRLSVEQKYPDAEYNLALMYNSGIGVAQDYAVAIRLYRLAIDQGYAPAQSNLGLMYHFGQGTEKNDDARTRREARR